MSEKQQNQQESTQNQQETQDQNNVESTNNNQQQEHQQSSINPLEIKAAELEKKNADLNDKLLRSLAELDNVRRRSKEELEKASKYAISNFVSELVVVVENFFLAEENSPKTEIEENPAIQNYAQAISMTKKELLKILEKYQVQRICPLNEKFDHNFHEALSQVESEAEEGTVINVIQSGYSISGRLIRPALVAVAKPKAA